MRWPTPAQILLLKAALRGDAGLSAYCEWRSLSDFETLEQNSGWVLPLLYCTLRDSGVNVPEMEKYEYVYRHNWYKNHLFLHQISAITQSLQRQGVSIIWLKGAASAVSCYQDIGARPINHFDFWTPPECRDEVAQYLLSAGWVLSGQHGDADAFKDRVGRIINVYGRLFDAETDKTLSDRTVPYRWDRQQNPLDARLLHPVDQFIYLCSNTDTWDSRSSLLWSLDAARLVNTHCDLRYPEIALRTVELGVQCDAEHVWNFVDRLLH